MFQSSPDPKAGCYVKTKVTHSRLNVSILTRPEGRVLLVVFMVETMSVRFNPHPTRRPGATYSPESIRRSLLVSILTRPEGRVLPANICPHSK